MRFRLSSIPLRRVILYIISLLCISVVFLIFGLKREIEDIEFVNYKASGIVGEMVDGMSISQKFVCLKNNLTKIVLLVATFEKTITDSDLEVEVYDAFGAVLKSMNIESESIKDNSQLVIEIPVQEDSKNKEYIVVLSVKNSRKGNAITFWTGDMVVPGSVLVLNGQGRTDIGLYMHLRYIRTYYGFTEAYAVSIFICVLSSVYILIPKKVNLKNKPMKV